MTRLLALVWPDLRVPWAETAHFDPMLDALDDLSPRVEAVDVGVALVDVTGLGPLHGGADERRIAARAVMLARGVAPLPVRCGTGDNRWLAVLAARLARPGGTDAPAAFRALPPGAAGLEELRDLPLTLLPADEATRQRFALFGLTCMGQLADLPRSAVGSQFGAAGERLQALARGKDPRSLVPRRRPERVATRAAFEPALDGIGAGGLVLRRACAELCDRLRARHLAPGRATLELVREDASPLRVQLAFPAPALEPDWIARLLLSRLEAAARSRPARVSSATTSGAAADEPEEPRVVAMELAFDRLADPAARQLPAFEARAGRWEELRWSLERLRSRFGDGRLWRAATDRPTASLPEHRSRLIDIGA
jgi:nucleotidyltransferase/DNA polymerase involved in DNA repair